jgi:hypothetical protein
VFYTLNRPDTASFTRVFEGRVYDSTPTPDEISVALSNDLGQINGMSTVGNTNNTFRDDDLVLSKDGETWHFRTRINAVNNGGCRADAFYQRLA